MDNAEKATVLERAADLLETVGHCKNASRWYGEDRDDGAPPDVIGYCATGAITEVLLEQGNYGMGVIPVYREIASRLVNDPLMAVNEIVNEIGLLNTIVSWNDAPERTASEVIDLMKNTAKDLRNG